MEQAIKKARNVKAPAPKAADSATKDTKTVKVDELQLQKSNQFDRFLEASCDCV